MATIASSLLKNTNAESVLKFVGTGTSAVSLNDLTTSVFKNCSMVSGDDFVTLKSSSDNIGIVLGGMVVGVGIPRNTFVKSKSGNKVYFDKDVTATSGNIEIEFDSQFLISPEVILSKLYFSTESGIVVKSSSLDSVIQINGTGHWNLNNMSVVDNFISEIIVDTTADDTLIVSAKKQGDWGQDIIKAFRSFGPRKFKPTPLSRGTIFVSPTGTDAGSGSLADPVDFQTAIDMAVPGDVVFLRGGVYDVTTLIRFWGEDGTAGNPIIYESYPGELAIFNGSSNIAGANVGFKLYANYQVLRNFCIEDMPKWGLYIEGSDNVIEHLILRNNKLSGVQLYDNPAVQPYTKASRNLFTSCFVYGNSDVGLSDDDFDNGGNADGFSVGYGDSNIVEFCIVYGNSDDGVDAWRSTNCVIRYNIIFSNGLGDGNGNGVKAGGIAPSNGTLIEFNLSFSNKSIGIDSNDVVAGIIRYNTTWNNLAGGFVSETDTQMNHNISLDDVPIGVDRGIESLNSWNIGGTVEFKSLDRDNFYFLMPVDGSPFINIGARIDL